MTMTNRQAAQLRAARKAAHTAIADSVAALLPDWSRHGDQLSAGHVVVTVLGVGSIEVEYTDHDGVVRTVELSPGTTARTIAGVAEFLSSQHSEPPA